MLPKREVSQGKLADISLYQSTRGFAIA